jgi:hypothetical protein
MPKVSVLMSVYNAERHVGEAIESILGQTFRDFEFAIFDDGSTDGTSEILRGFDDERIMLVENDENIGLTRSLNRGLRLARGEYIVRLDADDVALPERLEKQVQFLDTHPDVGLLGCAVEYIDPQGRTLGFQRVYREELDKLLAYHNWFHHSATAFRRECLDRVGSYREAFRYAQDYDLWLRILEQYGVACMPEPLVKIRLTLDSIAATRRARQMAYVNLAIELARQRREGGRDLLEDGTDLEPDIDSLVKPTPELLARGCLRRACLYYLLGDVAQAQESFIEAMTHAPAWLEEGEQVVKQVVSFGLGYTTGLDSRDGAVSFVDRVFSNLPPVAADLARLRPRAISRVYMESAFEGHIARDWPQVRRDIPRAVLRDLSWLGNRGVWSIFLRSLLRGLASGENV